MKNSNNDFFQNLITMEQLEPRLELAVAKKAKTEITTEATYGPGGCTLKVSCKISF